MRKSAMKSKKEKRKSQRISYPITVEYKYNRMKTYKKQMAFDLGGGGLGLRMLNPVEPKKTVTVLLYTEKSKKKPISAHCNVAWCRKCKDSEYFNAGLEFLKIKEKERFMEFLCEKILEVSLNEKE